MGRHDGDELVPEVVRAETLDTDFLPLQVTDGLDRLVREQLEAPGMHAGHHRERQVGIHRTDEICRVHHREIRLTSRDLVEQDGTTFQFDIADVGEAFRPQKLVGQILRRKTNAAELADPDRGRFRRRLVGEHATAAKHACGAGCGDGGEKIAARLSDLHRYPLKSASISNRVAHERLEHRRHGSANLKASIRLSVGMMARSTGQGKRPRPGVGPRLPLPSSPWHVR